MLSACINFLSQLRSFCLPAHCLLCQSVALKKLNLCDMCYQKLPILPQNCRQCGRFLPSACDVVCGQCLKSPPPYDAVYPLFPYQEPLVSLLMRFKFYGHLPSGVLFSHLLLEKMKAVYGKNLPDFFMVVPLHPSRLRSRGFNQSTEILRSAAKALNVPLLHNSLARLRATPSQSGLRAQERKINLINAFTTTDDFSGEHLLLFDDVMTTGITVTECANVLKKQGAERIDVWCALRRG